MANNGKQNPKAKQVSDSLRFSFRLSGRSTSITLRKNIVSLWVVLLGISTKEYDSEIYKFIEKCINDWGNDTARGLSDFVTEKMIQSILQKSDFVLYKRVFKKIK